MFKPELAYTFAGDNCAKEIGAAVARQAEDAKQSLSSDFIAETSEKALTAYKKTVGDDFSDTPRKIFWVQKEDAGFAIWSACYEDGKFVPYTHTVGFDGKCRAFAGDIWNKARYIVSDR